MCPECIASTAVIIAGAGSTGGILAACLGKFRRFFRVYHRSVSENKGEMNWQLTTEKTRSTGKEAH
jgi:prephenate dehydrogenase